MLLSVLQDTRNDCTHKGNIFKWIAELSFDKVTWASSNECEQALLQPQEAKQRASLAPPMWWPLIPMAFVKNQPWCGDWVILWIIWSEYFQQRTQEQYKKTTLKTESRQACDYKDFFFPQRNIFWALLLANMMVWPSLSTGMTAGLLIWTCNSASSAAPQRCWCFSEQTKAAAEIWGSYQPPRLMKTRTMVSSQQDSGFTAH